MRDNSGSPVAAFPTLYYKLTAVTVNLSWIEWASESKAEPIGLVYLSWPDLTFITILCTFPQVCLLSRKAQLDILLFLPLPSPFCPE